MKTALIKNGKVDNIIESSEKHNLSLVGKYEAIIDVSAIKADIGWAYDGTSIIEPIKASAPPKTQRQLDLEAANSRLKVLDLTTLDPIIADLIRMLRR